MMLRVIPLVVSTLASTSLALRATDIWQLTRKETIGAVTALAAVSLTEGMARVAGGALRERRLQDARRRCWESGQDLGLDLREHFAEMSDLTADQWADLPHEQRLGLSHDEYARTRQHGLVVATPVLDRSGKVIGVISADAPSGTLDRLWNEQVREVLGSGAVALRNLIE